MKLAFVFILGLFLCTSLSADEKKNDRYDEETKDLVEVDRFYIGGKYFAFLFIEADHVTFRCFLVKIGGKEPRICCEIEGSKVGNFFPYLGNTKNISPIPIFSF